MRPALQAALLLFLVVLNTTGGPANADGVYILKANENGQSVTLTTLLQLPSTDVEVTFRANGAAEKATYTGALLWDLLKMAGILSPDPKTRARQNIVVTGHDGYNTVVPLTDMDPELDAKRVVLAYRRDGRPLSYDEFRLVVPGEQRGGQNERVVRIELR